MASETRESESESELKAGYVYVVSNEMYKYYGEHIYKIGHSHHVIDRMRSYTTYYVEPPIVIYQSQCLKDSPLAEMMVFEKLNQYRMRKNREFFNCSLDLITKTIDEISLSVNEMSEDQIVQKKKLKSDDEADVFSPYETIADIDSNEAEKIQKYIRTRDDRNKLNKFMFHKYIPSCWDRETREFIYNASFGELTRNDRFWNLCTEAGNEAKMDQKLQCIQEICKALGMKNSQDIDVKISEQQWNDYAPILLQLEEKYRVAFDLQSYEKEGSQLNPTHKAMNIINQIFSRWGFTKIGKKRLQKQENGKRFDAGHHYYFYDKKSVGQILLKGLIQKKLGDESKKPTIKLKTNLWGDVRY